MDTIEKNAIAIRNQNPEGGKVFAVRLNNDEAILIEPNGEATIQLSDTDVLIGQTVSEAAAAAVTGDGPHDGTGEPEPAAPAPTPEPEPAAPAPADDTHVEGSVYEVDGVKSLYGKVTDEAGVESLGYLAVADLPDEVLLDLLAEGKLTDAEVDAILDARAPAIPPVAGAATTEETPAK